MNITIQLTPEQILQLSGAAQSISVEAFAPDIALRLLTEPGEREEIQAAIAHYTKVITAKGSGYLTEDIEFVRSASGCNYWLTEYELDLKVRKSYVTLRRHLLLQISASMRKELEAEIKKIRR